MFFNRQMALKKNVIQYSSTYCLATKGSELLIHSKSWMNLQGFMLSGGKKREPRTTTGGLIPFIYYSWNDKITKLKNRLVVARDWKITGREVDVASKGVTRGVLVIMDSSALYGSSQVNLRMLQLHGTTHTHNTQIRVKLMRWHWALWSVINISLLGLILLCLTVAAPWTAAPVFPVLHYLLEFAQTHVPWVGNAIHLPHPQLPPSPLFLRLSQNQGLFQWVGPLHQVAKYWSFNIVLPMNIQDWFPLGWTGWISLPSKGLSTVLSKFKSISSSVLSLLYGPTLTSIHDYWKKHSFYYADLCWQSAVSAF